MKKILTPQSGFTLVELMVVVAIIGILSTVAIPNFKRFQAKAKISEAKLVLASIYTNETSFMGEWDTFATCLGTMGITPPGKGYYVFGFFAANTTTNTNARTAAGDAVNATNCLDTDAFNFVPTAQTRVANTAATVAHIPANALVPDAGNGFIAGAAGKISSDAAAATFDRWTIDEDKILLNTTVGF